MTQDLCFKLGEIDSLSHPWRDGNRSIEYSILCADVQGIQYNMLWCCPYVDTCFSGSVKQIVVDTMV
jgi:hypothetical protein